MPDFDQDNAIVARDRRVGITRSDTGQSRRVANFLLAWWNAGDCGGFDLTDLRMVDRAIADDIFPPIRHEDPTAYGYGTAIRAAGGGMAVGSPGRPGLSAAPLPCPVMTPPQGSEA